MKYSFSKVNSAEMLGYLSIVVLSISGKCRRRQPVAFRASQSSVSDEMYRRMGSPTPEDPLLVNQAVLLIFPDYFIEQQKVFKALLQAGISIVEVFPFLSRAISSRNGPSTSPSISCCPGCHYARRKEGGIGNLRLFI